MREIGGGGQTREPGIKDKEQRARNHPTEHYCPGLPWSAFISTGLLTGDLQSSIFILCDL